MKYSFPARVRFSETDAEQNLSLLGILDYFQDCATFHSQDIGYSWDTLKAMDRVWLLSSWQICVNRYPRLCEEIVVTTWAHDFTNFLGLRNFTMTTKAGEVLAYANSVWSFIQISVGRPARLTQEMKEAYGREEPFPMTYASRKVTMPEGGTPGEPITVLREHLDVNGHVNNGRYVQLAMDFLPEDFPVHQLRVEYKMQAHLGDVLYPVLFSDDRQLAVSLNDANGRPYAVVIFEA